MNNRGGFTIVETLVVLAVTSVLFVAVISSISQRQNQIQFSQGIRDTTAMLRDILNDVSTGFFPTTIGLTCTAGSSNTSPQLGYDSSASDTTGAKQDCVLAGKVIQIGSDTDAGNGYVYSMAGRRLFYSGVNANDVSSFEELKPVVVDASNADNVTVSAGIERITATTAFHLPYGIKIVNSSENDSGRAFGIFYNDFRGTSLSGQQNSGVTNVAIANIASGATSQAGVISAADNTAVVADNFLASNETIVLCFKSGTNNQTATITLGPGIQGTLKVDFDVDLSGVTCG